MRLYELMKLVKIDGIIIPVVEHCLRAEIAEIAEA